MGFNCSRDREFKTIKIWMIEMPKLRLSQHNLHGLRLGCPRFDRGPRPRAPGQNRQTRCLLHDAVGSPAAPVLSARVSNVAGDCDRCVSLGEIGSGFDIYTFHEYFRSDEELHGPEDASVVRPVTGAPARQHVFIERIVHPNDNGVCFSPTKQLCNVERERGIALAPVFPGHLAIHPNRSRVKDRFELNPHCKSSPVRWHSKGATVPRSPVILSHRGLDLPRVRDIYLSPTAAWQVGAIPMLARPGVR